MKDTLHKLPVGVPFMGTLRSPSITNTFVLVSAMIRQDFPQNWVIKDLLILQVTREQ